jgi:CMP-N-acetylneuraminic acid synthetase
MVGSDQVIAFLPCRKGSDRVPRKNIRSFGHYPKGLVEIKLKQLSIAKNVDAVVLSTNDEEILDFAASLRSDKLQIHHRADELASSLTSTDALVAHALDLIPDGHILWTHVTSPFVTNERYDEIVTKYFQALQSGFDSLMTTTAIHGFLWRGSDPINYDRTIERWPRTQTLEVVHEVNSAVFLASTDIYRTQEDRIGMKPLLYSLDRLTAMDVDWEDDFLLAEQMLLGGIRRV